MTRRIEAQEYQKPEWIDFIWVVDGQRISGFMSVVEKGRSLMKVRLAIDIPSDAQLVKYGHVTRTPNDFDLITGRLLSENVPEDMVEISWWSPSLQIGNDLLIPRELADTNKEGHTTRVQIVDISLFSQNSSSSSIDNLS